MSFSRKSTATTATTNNTSTTSYRDESANAGGDGSIAVGAGATLNVTDISEEIARDALGYTAAVAGKAIDAGAKQTEFTVNTIRGLSETAARENADVRNSSDLAIKSTMGLTGQLQQLTEKALERAQTPDSASVATILKPVLWAAAVVLVAFAVFRRRRK